MTHNPYTLTFGKEPPENIPRSAQMSSVIESFTESDPSQQVYMITGVRGSGKTVFMTSLSKVFRDSDEWIVIELNPERDLLVSLAAKLSSENVLAEIFKSAKINLSFFGLGLAVDEIAPITDIETALTKMLTSLKKKNKRVLILIDEVTNTPAMKEFAGAFQIFLRQDLPVFLLMTGLYENINALQNEKSLTFLYRAPKIGLKPLNIGTIAENYRRTLGVSDPEALRMAKLTRGYSFAFQVLGYFTWEHPNRKDLVIQEVKQYLSDFVYEKIWSELSAKDKEIVNGIVCSDSNKISDIRETLNLTSNEFTPYRSRLIKRGIIDGEEHGHVRLTLPLFEDFVRENYAI